MIGPLRRSLSVVLLLGWLAPSAAALEVAIHVASEHHGSRSAGHGHAHDHELELADVMEAAFHGHHHDVDAASHHDHHALVNPHAPAVRPGAVKAISARPAVATGLTACSTIDQPSRQGPPKPLFSAHQSLRL